MYICGYFTAPQQHLINLITDDKFHRAYRMGFLLYKVEILEHLKPQKY